MTVAESSKFNSNWEFYYSFLKRQDYFLADFFTYHQSKKVIPEYQRVLIGMLHRYALNFRTMYRCWPDFRANLKFKFSVYSLLRPLIADYLLMLYLLEEFKFLVPTDAKHNVDEWQVRADDFEKRYKDISASFFLRFDSLLQKKVKYSELSAEDMQDQLADLRDAYPEFFLEGIKIKVRRSDGLTPAQMADQINYSKQFVKGLYGHYFRLSQFEHFTLITEGLMNDPDQNSEMMFIVDVTNCLLDFLNINISTLRAPLEFKTRAVDLINSFRSHQWMFDAAPDNLQK